MGNWKGINLEYEEELKIYTDFHRNEWNWWLHSLCIPLEWLGWLMLISVFNLHWVVSIVLAVYYCFIDSPVSSVSALCHILLAVIASFVNDALGQSITQVAIVSISLQAVAWSVQILIGHRLLEQNRPSFMISLSLNGIALSILLAWDRSIRSSLSKRRKDYCQPCQ
jgi:uncharacterized membrane protein YGL010W